MRSKFFLGLSLCLALFFGSSAAGAPNSDFVDIGNPLIDFAQQDEGQVANSMPVVLERLGGLLTLMLASLAVLSLLPIVFGGIMMITSQGSSERVEKGKSAVFWGFVGLTLAFMSILIYSLILRIALPS